MTNISFGSDPEFALVDTDGNLRSAIGIVPGGKKAPVPLGNGHTAFYDNVLAECCPVYGKTKQEVINNFRDCFQLYAKLVHPFKLKTQASQTFPLDECQHVDALQFGCEMQLNTYTMDKVDAPYCEQGNTFRTCGGHIHIGRLDGDPYPLTDFMGRYWVVRFLDMFVGIPSVVMDNDPTSHKRRILYGGSGNFRPKDYGVEYRPLSNFWLYPELVDLLHDLCTFTVNFMQQTPNHQQMWEPHLEHIREIIDQSNKLEASLFLRKILRPYLGEDLYNRIVEQAKIINRNFYASWNIKVD